MNNIHNCDNCKHSDKLLHEDPCCYCCSSVYCPLPYEKWEPKEEDNNENLNQDTV